MQPVVLHLRTHSLPVHAQHQSRMHFIFETVHTLLPPVYPTFVQRKDLKGVTFMGDTQYLKYKCH